MHRRKSVISAVVLGSILALPAAAQWKPELKHAPAIASNRSETSAAPAASVKDGFTFAAGGDLLGLYNPRLAMNDPALLKALELFQKSDAGFANLEANLFDTWDFKGAPAAENGGFEQGGIGSGPLLPKSVAADLKRFGITMLSTANNHSLDWGVEGLAETLRNLNEAGLVHAGAGLSLQQARAPGYLTTSRGRVALIGAATTFMPMSPAGAGGGDGRQFKAPRPGIAAIRSRPIALVTAPELEVMKGIAKRQGKLVDPGDTEVTLTPNEAIFIQQTFRLSDRTGLTYELNQEDRDGVLRAVRMGKQGADLAVFSIHAHETESGGQELDAAPDTLAPADFMQGLFHDAIDTGADIVVTHGPHVLRGVEIYNGKPIFYGMGSLFFELGTDWRREWFESVIAISEFRGGRVAEVRLYPITLGLPEEKRSRLDQGTPRLATGEAARRILESLQRSSQRYNTKISIENGIGVIRVGS
ncbi:CapA family protein [Steroidobacter flavus]|uniref:CapA family protein n=1 Tax=Steroidobacter flavus TaxID=1842136 RepID=A0ABV8SZY8_9GAMM